MELIYDVLMLTFRFGVNQCQSVVYLLPLHTLLLGEATRGVWSKCTRGSPIAYRYGRQDLANGRGVQPIQILEKEQDERWLI